MCIVLNIAGGNQATLVDMLLTQRLQRMVFTLCRLDRRADVADDQTRDRVAEISLVDLSEPDRCADDRAAGLARGGIFGVVTYEASDVKLLRRRRCRVG